MNSTQLIGEGYQKIADLKQLFLSLTDSDLLLLEEKQYEILDKLQTNFGNTKHDKRILIAEA